jgi:hypothetical protein
MFSLLTAFYHRTNSELRGKRGGPLRTWFVRVVALLVVLRLCGSLCWAALWSMPTAVVVFVALVIVGRIGLWYWRGGR